MSRSGLDITERAIHNKNTELERKTPKLEFAISLVLAPQKSITANKSIHRMTMRIVMHHPDFVSIEKDYRKKGK